MGSFSDWLMGTDPTTEQLSTLSPEQQEMSKQFASYITPNIGTELQRYTGQSIAGMSPQEIEALNRVQSLMGGTTPLADQITSAYERALSGQPSTTINTATTEALVNAQRQRDFALAKETNAYANEQFIGGPGYWSSPTQESSRKFWQDYSNQQAVRDAELRYQDEQARRGLSETAADRALAAGPQATAFGVYQRERPFEEAGILGQMGALPRMLEQAQLDWDYKEFLRTRPEMAPYLNQALQFLGINQVENIVTPGTQGNLGELIKTGAALALAPATGGTSLVGTLPTNSSTSSMAQDLASNYSNYSLGY